MDQVKAPFSLRCPHHSAHVIEVLNVNPNAKKPGYCSECLVEDGRDRSSSENFKTVSIYLKESSDFYEKCRQRVRNAGEPPAKFLEELSKKEERLEKLSQHIDKEKEKVKRNFEEIRKTAMQIINEKEKRCLELLDKEISGLSEAYTQYEKLLMMGWPKPSDIQNMYPETDILEQKMSQIENVDQLRAFIARISEDVQILDKYFVEDDGLFKIKKRIDGLIRGFSVIKDSLPEIQSPILSSENMRKALMKEFTQQEIKIENSVISRLKAPNYQSKIIVDDDQFETLRDWLPKGYNFELKLLFRGSEDGMSSDDFHEKCDGQGATITLIKCRFEGVLSSSIIGGFLDKSWKSNSWDSTSEEAFLFSLGENNDSSVKCPIEEDYFEEAFLGYPQFGPIFGTGHDLYLEGDLESGEIRPKCYSNSSALKKGKDGSFTVEEIEVYQVK